jgi:glycosyltransferase involved in cell wall biosynthesis
VAERPLRIGIDGRELAGRPTGVGRYLAAILREWEAAASGHEFVVYAPVAAPAGFRTHGHVTWRVVAGAGGTWWEQTALTRAVNGDRIDVLFAGGYTAPLRVRCPVVLAIYDVSFFAHPEWFGWREGWRRRLVTHKAAGRASSIVTISEFSAAEIVRFLSVPRARILIAPPGPPEANRPVSPTPRAPLVLFAGSLFNRRHIPELIAAFAGVAATRPDARLVLAGDNRTRPSVDPDALAQSHGVGDRVEWRQYVDDAELQSLYDRARLFVFLSDYEGFAMTPFEAIAAGAPPVLLDTPVAREVYGDGARLVPLDVPAITAAMASLLDDDGARAALLAAGRDRVARLSWPRSASAILTAIERAADRTPVNDR